MRRIPSTLHFKPGIENILNSEGTNSELRVIIGKMINYNQIISTIYQNTTVDYFTQ